MMNTARAVRGRPAASFSSGSNIPGGCLCKKCGRVYEVYTTKNKSLYTKDLRGGGGGGGGVQRSEKLET